MAIQALTGIALCAAIASAFAFVFGVLWLRYQERKDARAANLSALEARLVSAELVTKLLAEEWKEKFDQLEAEWKKLKEHADSQFAGAVAQVSAVSSRPWGR